MVPSGKALWGLAMTGAMAVVAIGVAYLAPPTPTPTPTPPPDREVQPILGPREADVHVPSACRTATASGPDCTAAWEARQRHFFDEASSSLDEAASNDGGRP